MNIYDALHDFGVRDDTLAPEEKAALDQNGYLALKDVLSAAQLATMSERLAQLLVAEGANAGTEVHQEAGTDRLSDLINKDAVFDVCFTNPRLLAAMAYVLGGEFKLSSLNFRAALPGSGLQDLHADWGEAVTPGDYHVCNSIWLLDDFTEKNGATRVVPGTHRSGNRPGDEMSKPSDTHPNEIRLIAPAGTVGVFNSHL